MSAGSELWPVPEDDLDLHAWTWHAQHRIIAACEKLTHQYGLDPELLEDLREADSFTEDWASPALVGQLSWA